MFLDKNFKNITEQQKKSQKTSFSTVTISYLLPSQHLTVQRQHWKNQSNVQKLIIKPPKWLQLYYVYIIFDVNQFSLFRLDWKLFVQIQKKTTELRLWTFW